ncbi:hypothetical protein [Streptomyces sp. NPDC097610]|uniref:hypothetical protein n=1 Tax=Streptomyces sp. NPDC097610 TaxID=3157227 RepID=UPI0033286310
MPALLSADGRTIAFDYGGDEELVPGEPPSAASTVYVRDLRKDVTRRVNAGPADENGVREHLRTGITRLVSESVTGEPVTDVSVAAYSVSAGARRIGLGSESAQLALDDTNGHYDGFVRRLR